MSNTLVLYHIGIVRPNAIGFDRKMIRGNLKKKKFKSKGGTLVFSKTKIVHGGFFFEKKIKTPDQKDTT